ncbi:response regulator [Pelagicoccus sp. SDUM812002]|uniref:PAS domain-containing response regulator n=1 Tax=Pelagicoccus sp. SDUM812002 TaxID=3041266 RepID=UPI00280EA791|nr:response regulator [Pelagicoccus sp. SDUM812002]MDQ8185351.1 response regulator [Pelagicoccus sp. SDUM812002]
MSDNKENKVSKGKLRVLIVEDSKIEAKFTANLLKKNGYEVTSERVETREDMKNQLDEQEWDIVISDYQMPEFDGMQALQLFQAYDLDIPFILVSGKIGEESAVDLMKMGAQDYIMKGNTARLLPAIESHLKDASNRREKVKLESKLRESEAQYRGFFENAAIGIFRCDAQGKILDVNSFLAHALGFETRGDCIQVCETLSPEVYDHQTHQASTVELAAEAQQGGHFEATFHRQDNSTMEAIINVWAIKDQSSESVFLEGTIEDVTEQREMERKLREMEQLHESLIDLTSNL